MNSDHHPTPDANRDTSKWLHVLAILVVSLLVLTWNLGNTQLWDQDEGYYAATAAEMYERGDVIVPMFNGAMFGHKPPMMFWGMMLGYQLFSVSELGARIVSALFGVATAMVTYRIGTRLFDRATGLFSGLALGSCVMFSMVARSATADAHLTFFVALALYVWMRDVFPVGHTEDIGSNYVVSRKTWAMTYAVMALAVLTKGPIGLLFPMAVIGLFMLTQIPRRRFENTSLVRRLWTVVEPYSPIPFLQTVWRMRPWLAIAMVVLVAGPWYAVVQWKTDGQFLNEFIGVHHLGRFSHAMDNHSGPAYYYLIACLIGMYPWSAFAIPAMLEWIRDVRDTRFSKPATLIACWIGVYLVIFSLARTKLPNYVLPAYPALAIVLGRYVALWSGELRSVSRRWLFAGWIVMAALGLVLVVGFPAAGGVAFQGETLLDRLRIDPSIQTRFQWLGVIGLPLMIGGGAGWWLTLRHRMATAAWSFSIASCAMLLVLWQYVAPEIDRFQMHQRLATMLRDSQPAEEAIHQDPCTVAVYGYFRPTMVFYLGRPIQFCETPEQAVAQFEGHNACLVTTDTLYRDLQASLPSHVQVIHRVAQFPRKGELVVLGDGRVTR